MANRVKISSIGAAGFAHDGSDDWQALVERMKSYWRGQFAQVLPDRPDLIVVPEACDRSNGMDNDEKAAYYAVRGDQIRDLFVETARENHCYMAYSAARRLPDGTWRNSTQIIDRQGEVVGVYSKNHLVVGELGEDGRCGKDAPLIQCDFGTVGCAICFDLNFDPIRLKYVEQRPDLILFSSMYHGGLMQAYWAYSCRAHFVGSIHGLPNAIISPVGETLASSTNYRNYVTAAVNLDCAVAHLDFNGPKFSAMRKKYGPKVRVHDPGFLGSVLISSETDELTVQDLIEEFEIELLDDYWARSLADQARRVEA